MSAVVVTVHDPPRLMRWRVYATPSKHWSRNQIHITSHHQGASRKRIKLEDESDSGEDEKKHLTTQPAPELQYGPIPSSEELINRQRQQQNHANPMSGPAHMYHGAPPPPFPGPMYYAPAMVPMYYAPPPPMMPPPLPLYPSLHPRPADVPLTDMIDSLGTNDLRDLVYKLAVHDPSSFARFMLEDAYNFNIRNAQTQTLANPTQPTAREEVLDFDHLSKDAWHIINTSHYANLKSSKQYEASFDAFEEVKECIEAIAEQADPDASFGTKLSALETLRKIGKTIVLSGGGCLQHEIRKQFQGDPCLPDAMCAILESMEEEECLKAGRNVLDIGKGSLLDKTEWLSRQWKSYCLDGEESFDAVLEALGYDHVKSEVGSD